MNYTCAHCGGVFTSTRPEEEARAEAEQWGDRLEKQGEATICDDCYGVFIAWARREGLVHD